MTEFLGSLAAQIEAPPIPGTAREAYTWRPQFSGLGVTVDDTSALAEAAVAGTYLNTGGKSAQGGTQYLGRQGDEATPAIDWFETFHVIPRSFDFGNVLSTQVASIEVYNAFRRENHYWTAFMNNAGAGVTLSGMPSLPALIFHQDGVVMTLQVSTSGPPLVIATLDFVFDTGDTIYVPISLQRVVLFHVPPVGGYREVLQFLTDVIPHMDDTEQRIRLRKCPRQFFEWTVFLEDGQERDRIEAILFDWQTQVFGVPIWREEVHTTAAHLAGVTTINVPTTAFADYRVGGLFLIYKDQFTFDVLELAATPGATTLVATTATLNAYPIGAEVMPLRTALAPSKINGTRWRINGSELQIRFQVNDNDSDIASSSGWATYNSKVLLSDPNVVDGTMREEYAKESVILDSQTGLVDQQSPSDRGRRASRKTFWTNTPAGLWSVRQLMHFLGGRQTSHYLPTFFKDLELNTALVSGANTMVVKYVGYAQFVRNRSAKNVIRVLFTDGTTLIRAITASSLTTPTTETLTLDSTWPANRPVSEIERIEYVEKIRADSDTIEFEYPEGETTARISYPVRTVLE